MADRSPQQERDPHPDRYVITATVIDGTIRLTGPDINNNTIEVPRGEDAMVKIQDTEGYYLYAVEVPQGGEQSACWARVTTDQVARRLFTAVDSEINNVVFAAAREDSANVAFGPIIKVKPQG
jgi:hypothetical protein